MVIDDKYEIVGKLGSGGMATVYRATRRLIGDTVAIKILHQDQVRDPQSAERFRREAQAAARLKHPNAVTIHDFGVSPDGLIYLVMELVEGKSLRAMIREDGPLTPSTAAEILRQACAALQEAHKQNIVHRDIKPDNIVVDVTPVGLRVKVLDFGIARMRDIAAANITQTGSVMGTPHYMSPEQCLGEELDARSDIYSLGIVLFEMLAGIVPFNSPTSTAVAIQHVNQSPPPLRVINISVPPAVEAVVLHALSKRREDRPRSAQLLADEFASALVGDASTSGVRGDASIPVRKDLASTMRMSIPVSSGTTPDTAQVSKHRDSRLRPPWIWLTTAAIPLMAVASWFAYSSSTRAGSVASISSDSISKSVPAKETMDSLSAVASPEKDVAEVAEKLISKKLDLPEDEVEEFKLIISKSSTNEIQEYRVLEREGLISFFVNQLVEGPNEFISLEEKGKQYLEKGFKPDPDRESWPQSMPVITSQIAFGSLGAIKKTGDNTVEVSFTLVRNSITPFGRVIFDEKEETMHRMEVFSRFADGWKIGKKFR